MKRQTRIKIRRIKYFLTSNIRKVLYFPIAVVKLILSPLYIARAVFFPTKRTKYPRLDKDVYNKFKEVERSLKSLHLLNNDALRKIHALEEITTNHYKSLNALEAEVTLDNKLSKFASEDRINNRLKALEVRIQSINTRLKESGILNDIELIVQPTDEELEAIEADARYSSDFEVVKPKRKEPDFKAEQKALSKQLAKRAEEDKKEGYTFKD